MAPVTRHYLGGAEVSVQVINPGADSQKERYESDAPVRMLRAAR